MNGNVLCFGDSNTWGLNPDTWKRYPKEVRWTGILTKELQGEYHVVEEGLNGRTANEHDELEPFLNGRDYMTACVLSHRPVTVLVVMLGTNDVKSRYNKSAEAIAASVADLTKDMETVLKNSQEDKFKVILMAPRSMDERVYGDGTFDKNSIIKSEMLSALLKEKALENGWSFIDADIDSVERGCDGLHLAVNGHKAIAELVLEEIRK
ncbi:MAG: hypothetical protein E7265_04345 [Lachnospiraceae bacterium]|nr:hypothetical protein [Lachnospiraceae bacterium]